MTDTGFPPAWAVLAPARPDRLRTLLRRYWDAHHQGMQDVLPLPEVIEGGGEYAAAAGGSPGASSDQAVRLARTLSQQVDGVVYLLDLDEDLDRPARAWRAGVQVEETEREPWTFAAELGVTLQPALELSSGPPAGSAVVLVEDAPEAEVRSAVDAMDAPGPIRFQVQPAPRGILVRLGAVSTFVFDLGEALPGHTLWALEWRPGRFTCTETRDGEVVSFFAHPGATDAERTYFPVVDEVRGLRDPAEIARALGVPVPGDAA